MSRERGEVVVRVRRIAEDRAAISAAGAVAAAHAASVAAQLARERSKQHPLEGRTGAMSVSELATAAGSGAALREASAAADRHETSARAVAVQATDLVVEARAKREAAERFLDRRRAASDLEASRKSQRQADESATAMWRTA